MKIQYDAEADALHIVFLDATVTTKHLGEGIAADFDQSGRLAGLEVLDVTRRLGGRDSLRRVSVEGLGSAVTAVREKAPEPYSKTDRRVIRAPSKPKR
ncbi:MAG: DUF2283 domain-containing protein [Candidatus Aminicenantes bacterium]|nr:DUF2283 domain-containing protein [Candidatus Aminicenantes bacterium]